MPLNRSDGCFLGLVENTGIISIAVHNHDFNQHGAILRSLDIMILRLGDLNFCIFSILISAANELKIQASRHLAVFLALQIRGSLRCCWMNIDHYYVIVLGLHGQCHAIRIV
jgi:hypothetical protein